MTTKKYMLAPKSSKVAIIPFCHHMFIRVLEKVLTTSSHSTQHTKSSMNSRFAKRPRLFLTVSLSWLGINRLNLSGLCTCSPRTRIIFTSSCWDAPSSSYSRVPSLSVFTWRKETRIRRKILTCLCSEYYNEFS